MSDLVLVINSGSSSIKYVLIALGADEPHVWATGLVERIGEQTSRVTHTTSIGGPSLTETVEQELADHRQGFQAMQEVFAATGPVSDVGRLRVVGHRVVHGGDRFAHPTLVDDEVLAAIGGCVPLAPLHNPSNLLGIQVARSAFPDVPQVAVFDTAFHQTMPESAYRYAMDAGVADLHRIRKYGFHGTSHAFVSRRAAHHLGRPVGDTRLITLHLGNGASACAVDGGRSVETSMGLTPLAGLVMGTRSGDIDPGVVLHLLRNGMELDEVDALLNRRSGLKGLCGDNDLRVIHQRAATGDAAAERALGVYVHRLRLYLGGYLAVLGGADAIVFTGGVGQNDAAVRAAVCEGLEWLGIAVDPYRNAIAAGSVEPVDIATEDSRIRVLVVPTNEELEIARQSLAALA